jgi:hypothetical protein
MMEHFAETGRRAGGRLLSSVLGSVALRTSALFARLGESKVNALATTGGDARFTDNKTSGEPFDNTQQGESPTKDEPGFEVPKPTVVFGTLGPTRTDPRPHTVTPEMRREQDKALRALRAKPLPAGQLPNLYAKPGSREQ